MFVWGLQRDNENLTIQPIEKKNTTKYLKICFLNRLIFCEEKTRNRQCLAQLGVIGAGSTILSKDVDHKDSRHECQRELHKKNVEWCPMIEKNN